jgi:hypothetical protein
MHYFFISIYFSDMTIPGFGTKWGNANRADGEA